MALLSDPDRAAAAAELMQLLSLDREPCDALKAEIRAFIDATDTWQDQNAASYNSALPVGPRTKMTAAQKSRGFEVVSKKRYQKGA